MNKIIKKNLRQELAGIPEKLGIFICRNDSQVIFFKITENLKKFIELYLISETEDLNLIELRAETSIIEYTESQDLFFCLIEEKLFLNEYHPEYNNRIKIWKDYPYLSVQWKFSPYLRTSQDTLGNSAYVGPFRTGFFVQDIMDTFADIYKLPVCEDEVFPCDRMNDFRCPGYCVYTEDESLRSILSSFYLFPNLQILNDIRKKIELLEEELNFTQSEMLADQLKIIEAYYRQLLFLYTSRLIDYDLTIENIKISIKNGLISEIKLDKKTLSFVKEDLPRDNELLAYNKDELDERWIVYRYFENNHANYLKEVFHKNNTEIRNKLISFVENNEN
jgi:excinuclease UvrABC nuclease subunit